MLIKIISWLVATLLCLISFLLFTAHPGVAIKLLNYTFFIILLVYIYKLVKS
ncbi:MAG: hypothetical protein ABH812_00690 [bacterium]